MKVFGIFGSPRRGGNTELLLEEALKGAEKEGAKVECLYLSDFTITPCKECHGCDDTGNCIILDEMEKVYPKLLEADVVILSSPIFFYGVTAWAKALIDRSQALWARKYLLKDPSLGKEGKKEKRERVSLSLWERQKDRKFLKGPFSRSSIFLMSSTQNMWANWSSEVWRLRAIF